MPMVPELPRARCGWVKRGRERWKASAAKVRMSSSRLGGTLPMESKVSVRRTDPMATVKRLVGVIAGGDGDLGGAAADVHHEISRPRRLAAQHAQRDEARLLLPGDDLELETGGGEDPGHDVGAVLGLADGARGHRAYPCPVPAGQRRVTAQRRQEPLLHLARDAAGLEDPLAGPDRVPLGVEDVEGTVGERPRQLEPHRVRAHVDGAEDPGVNGRVGGVLSGRAHSQPSYRIRPVPSPWPEAGRPDKERPDAPRLSRRRLGAPLPVPSRTALPAGAGRLPHGGAPGRGHAEGAGLGGARRAPAGLRERTALPLPGAPKGSPRRGLPGRREGPPGLQEGLGLRALRPASHGRLATTPSAWRSWSTTWRAAGTSSCAGRSTRAAAPLRRERRTWSATPAAGRFSPAGAGGSRFRYHIDIDPGGSVPSWIVNMANKSQVPSVVAAVEDEAQKLAVRRARSADRP